MNWETHLRGLMLGYPPLPESVNRDYPAFLQTTGGLALTLLITFFSLIFGGALGTLLGLLRRDAPKETRRTLLRRGVEGGARLLANGFVEGVRGLPIMLLVLLCYYLPYPVLGVRIPPFLVGIFAFSLYTGVYLSEIVRSGFRSIDPGLRYAGRTLGLPPRIFFFKVELPLALRAMKPDLINLAITVFKDTSTLAMVGVAEITYIGRQTMAAHPKDYALVLGVILISYWVPATLLSLFASRTEKARFKMETL